MPRVDAKTVGAAALIGLAGLTYRPTGNTPPSKGVEETLSAHRGSGVGQANYAAVKAQVKTEFDEALDFHGHKPKYLIATVPDPDGTALRLYTDRAIDAISLAAFEFKYVLVKHWLPWKFSLERMDEEYVQRKLQVAEMKERAKYPGVLVFEQEKGVLIVFLVPESPTAGIRRDVLAMATEVISQDRQTAPFVGPSYTGGLESIEESFEDGKIRTAISRIVTGSVTGLSKAPKYFIEGTGHPPFQWTRMPRWQSDSATEKFLRNRRPGRDRIVYLAEDSTSFGTAATHENETHKFPWQISRLRNAMPEVRAGAAAGGSTSLFSTQLQLRDLRRPEGALPMYAGEQTPAIQEAVLAQITTGIERTPKDYVAIRATDIMDAVFLTRLLRAGNPSQRIFTNDGDLLFLRAQEESQFTGLLTALTFPITNHLRLPSLPNKVFDSEYSYSIFVAAKDAIECPERGGRSRLEERPLWLLALGRNGYWPVARLAEGSGEMAKDNVPKPERPTLLWVSIFWMTFGACVAWLMTMLAARKSWISGLADFRIKPDWPGAEARVRSLGMLNLALAAIFVAAAMPVWFPLRQILTPDADRYLGMQWKGGFWLGLGLLTASGFAPWIGTTLSRGTQIRAALFSLGPLILVSAAWQIFRGDDDGYLLWQFFLVRSQDYLNGLAPLLPFILLLMGFAGCAWSCHLATLLSTERFVNLGGLPEYPGDCRRRFNSRSAWIALGLAALAYFPTIVQIHSLEPILYDRTYAAVLLLLFAWLLYACFTFRHDWLLLKRFLDRIELHPLRFVLSELAKKDGATPIWESHPRRKSFIFYGRAKDCLRKLQEESPDSQVASSIRAIDDYLKSTKLDHGCYRKAVEQELSDLLQRFETDLGRYGGPWQAGASEIVESTAKVKITDTLKQEFIARRLGAYIRCSFLHMRTQLTAMTAAFVAMTLSLNSYAFGPDRVIQVFTIGLVVLIAAAVISVFAQMHSNPILERMSGPAAGVVDWSFWAKVTSAVALPILSLLASYTPAIGKFLGAWLQPALEAVSR